MADIHITGLRKKYGGPHGATVVDGLDLVVRDGEVIALLGPSGCGKTTTLQLLAGFVAPDEGEIRVGDRVLSSPGRVVPPERRNMSLIFQSYAVWPHKTVFENVAYGLELRKTPRAAIEERVKRVLDSVRLGAYSGRYPGELSGGQQQRVALARAIVVEPEILLLDEPLSNLDANLREEMRFEIRRLHDETGVTMVYVTHDQSEAMVTADRIAIMRNGRIEQVGTPIEIYERPATTFTATFIGRTNALEGTLVEPGVVSCAGTTVRTMHTDDLARGANVFVCVRPQHLLLEDGGGSPNGRAQNRLPGRVVRDAYLGEYRDYLIDLGEGKTIRVNAPPSQVYAVGDEVTVCFDVDASRAVPS